MYEEQKIALVLLAAGDSRRYGGNKLLDQIEGRPMYRHVMDEVLALPESFFCKRILVSQYGEILACAGQAGFTAVENRESSLGISHSIHLGLQAAEAAGAEAVCFSVCDQPWLKGETIKALIEGWKQSGLGLGTLSFQGRDGNPAIFSSSYFPELKAITGDKGGRAVLKCHESDVYRYEVRDGQELEDVDVRQITDFSMPELDVYARLSEVQLLRLYEPDTGIFIAESPKVVERALRAGYEPLSLLLETKHVEGEARAIVEQCRHVPVYTAEFDLLKQLTGFPLTRGVLCAMRRKPLPGAKTLLEGASRIAVLENVMNPTNVGAVFRSAAALNLDAVILTPGCSDPLYRRSSRVSMGTVFQIPWTFFDSIREPWPSRGIPMLKKLGFKTVAMALKETSVSLDDPVLKQEEKLAILIGNEGEGLMDETIADCDYTVKIPMGWGADSLNAAVAAGIAFWELRKR